MTPSPAPSPAGKRPLYRNPWVVAWLVGVTTITLMRPCTRHEPEPPEPIGALATYELEDATGQVWGTERLRGRVYVLGFYSRKCAGDQCNRILPALAELQKRYTEREAPIWVVGVSLDFEDSAQAFREWVSPAVELYGPIVFLRGIEADSLALLRGLAAMAVEQDLRFVEPWDWGLVLIDQQGRCRGFYGTTSDLGVDEVLHRAMHVLRDSEDAT